MLVAGICQSCSSSKALERNSANTTKNTPALLPFVEQYINCLNERNTDCLMNLYDADYKSYSPILAPADLASFVRETVENLRKNNFEVAVKIKDIDQGDKIAYITMDWQLKSIGTPKDTDPFASVQRLDLWKLDKLNKWRILRTVIYNEKAF